MSKQKLYIIHGWTYTVAPWDQTIELLKKQDISVEMLHVPGLTTSSKKVWTIEDYTKWADRNLPDGAVALGHSNGGRILLNLCSEKPEKLKQLILLDAAGVYEPSSKRDVARSLSKKLSFLKKVPGLTKVWHKLTGASDYARAPQNMKETLANMLDSDKNLDLTKVATPTSILWGEADVVTPPRQAEVMHAKIPHNTLELYPDWTHAPYISHPKELASAIVKVLKHPPEKVSSDTEPIADTTKVSAALAIKRAEKPVLKATSEPNAVAPDVPTKLTLRKEGKPTEGLVVSDDEGAAVKYEAKVKLRPKKITNTAKISASAGFRKAKARQKLPDTDVAQSSASSSLKKSDLSRSADNTKAKSAALAIKKGNIRPESKAGASATGAKIETKAKQKVGKTQPALPEGVSFVELEPIVPAGIISSADVEKPKTRRKTKKTNKASQNQKRGQK